MVRLRKSYRLIGLLALLVAVAAIALPFSHNRSRAASTPDFSEYALPDGTLPVLCLPGSGQHKNDGSGSEPCSACRLAEAIAALPEVALATVAPLLFQFRLTEPEPRPALYRDSKSAPQQPRAPPRG